MAAVAAADETQFQASKQPSLETETAEPVSMSPYMLRIIANYRCKNSLRRDDPAILERVCAMADLPIRQSNGQLVPYSIARNSPWRWINARNDGYYVGMSEAEIRTVEQDYVKKLLTAKVKAPAEYARTEFEWHARHIRNLVRVILRLPSYKDRREVIRGKEGLLLSSLATALKEYELKSQVEAQHQTSESNSSSQTESGCANTDLAKNDSPLLAPQSYEQNVRTVTVQPHLPHDKKSTAHNSPAASIDAAASEVLSLRIIQRSVSALLASCVAVDEFLASMGVAIGPDGYDGFFHFAVPQASEEEQRNMELDVDTSEDTWDHPEDIFLSSDGCWTHVNSYMHRGVGRTPLPPLVCFQYDESYRLNIDLPRDLDHPPWAGFATMRTAGSEALKIAQASREEADRKFPKLFIRPQLPLDIKTNALSVADSECRFLSFKATSMRERCADLLLASNILFGTSESMSESILSDSSGSASAATIVGSTVGGLECTSTPPALDVNTSPLSQLQIHVSQLISNCTACIDSLTAHGWNQEIVSRYARDEKLPALGSMNGKPFVIWMEENNVAPTWLRCTHTAV